MLEQEVSKLDREMRTLSSCEELEEEPNRLEEVSSLHVSNQASFRSEGTAVLVCGESSAAEKRINGDCRWERNTEH